MTGHPMKDSTTDRITQPSPQKPKCAVRGNIEPGAMCGSVIVGGVFCGFAGTCPHKIEVETPAEIGRSHHAG